MNRPFSVSILAIASLGCCVANAAQAATHNDFDGDGHSDLLWRNASTGSNVIWRSANYGSLLSVQRVANPDWVIVGTGDFDLDQKADILWRNRATGVVVIWHAAAASKAETPVFDWSSVGSYSTQWEIAGVGDFSGDGYPQIFWRNRLTGNNALAFYDWFDGFGYFVYKTNTTANPGWQVAGVGDFDGDGLSEIFWRNTASGANALWQLAADSTFFAGVALTPVNLAWQVAGVGDFNGDGRSDIFWRNGSTGADVLWYSGQSASSKVLAPVTDLHWQVTATGDFDGDGNSDVFWRNARTGANVIWRSADYGARMTVAGVTNLAWSTVM